MNKDKNFIKIDGLYEVRIAIMMEESPQSNKYSQIMLTQEQFSKISKFIRSTLGPCGIKGHLQEGEDKCVKITVSNEITCKLPSELRSFYSKEELDDNVQ